MSDTTGPAAYDDFETLCRRVDAGPVRRLYYHAIHKYGSGASRQFPFGPLFDMDPITPDLGGIVIGAVAWQKEDENLMRDLNALGMTWKSIEGPLLCTFITCANSLDGFSCDTGIPSEHDLRFFFGLQALYALRNRNPRALADALAVYKR